ncbi:MAG: RnfH family protein [Zetaproteobacteria bacterium CG06_land_8_20_14_3_00_59_53]|nr:MAG: RnfH family protein [Zetaproteobacteria bacterium CG2_30_59_37]PIO89136.1 MAG: RnfH family protein [Zetaproteobacteria bacterium CG23_combo_of_CG06-09_8_20_14_all_59_86]PIQ64449.1 MAG: RnfH family protein [Zetaproteobacteria bacterium CG11_big_fil_rev_8_21_14_0_20_59_439]PIU70875.1 MAG: RnfH family protein [Zetaproteobacteria bacterium CG06_land_8_20_14_3_00_59_53]PIU96312.1 MAG: RnfH family protein [Zetaproteobacteria bacterium CG03_land_8_20_14_0_80_59_51]PIY45154.1 MAG: RnfH family 
MNITVAYALPTEQTLEEMEVPEGTTAEEAIAMSHLLEKYPEIDLAVNKVGVLGKLVALNNPLRDGDRVEIYRPLPRKPRDAHAVDDKKDRIRARKEQRAEQADAEG